MQAVSAPEGLGPFPHVAGSIRLDSEIARGEIVRTFTGAGPGSLERSAAHPAAAAPRGDLGAPDWTEGQLAEPEFAAYSPHPPAMCHVVGTQSVLDPGRVC